MHVNACISVSKKHRNVRKIPYLCFALQCLCSSPDKSPISGHGALLAFVQWMRLGEGACRLEGSHLVSLFHPYIFVDGMKVAGPQSIIGCYGSCDRLHPSNQGCHVLGAACILATNKKDRGGGTGEPSHPLSCIPCDGACLGEAPGFQDKHCQS